MTVGGGPDRPVCLLLAEETWGSTLHAMRSLDACGAPVLVAVAGDGAPIYRSSRACSAAEEIPVGDPSTYCAAVRDWTRTMVGHERTVVVMPLSDRLADHLNANRELFQEQFRLAIAGPESVDHLLDKRSALQIAETAGLQVPAWEGIDAGGKAASGAGTTQILTRGPWL